MLFKTFASVNPIRGGYSHPSFSFAFTLRVSFLQYLHLRASSLYPELFLQRPSSDVIREPFVFVQGSIPPEVIFLLRPNNEVRLRMTYLVLTILNFHAFQQGTRHVECGLNFVDQPCVLQFPKGTFADDVLFHDSPMLLKLFGVAAPNLI